MQKSFFCFWPHCQLAMHRCGRAFHGADDGDFPHAANQRCDWLAADIGRCCLLSNYFGHSFYYAPTYGRRGIKQRCNMSVCLSCFVILSPGWWYAASLLQMHSLGGSTVGYAYVKMLTAGGISVRRVIRYLCHVSCL